MQTPLDLNEVGIGYGKLTMGDYIGHSILVPGVGMLLVEEDCGCSICDETPFREPKSAEAHPTAGICAHLFQATYQFSIAP